jgi:outer membrane immunogenic protein
MVAPSYNWTGFYIGAHGGWGRGSTDWLFPFADPFNLNPGDTTSNKPDGWLAGGQIGFNWQNGPWVLGLEATWAGADIEEKFQSPFNVNVDFYSWVDSIYTVTGRVGYAWDRWLVYGKGGFASAEIGTKIQNRVTLVTWDHGARHDGWILGAGVEFMLAPNWILGVEYNYMDLGDARHEGLQTNGLLTRTDIDATVQTIVARLSYKFGWAKGPVMAKY